VCYVQGWEELERLQLKTERVEVRQREHEKCQRLKREKIAMGNSTMQALLKDAKVQIFSFNMNIVQKINFLFLKSSVVDP
jgi:hypothetical protein